MKLEINYKISYVKLAYLIFRQELIIRLTKNTVDLKSRILNKLSFFNYYDKNWSNIIILKNMMLFYNNFFTFSRRYNCLVYIYKFFKLFNSTSLSI